MKTPLNKETVRQHLTYSWWKYLLVVVLGIFVMDLLFTVTAYHAPDNKKIEFYVYGYADTDNLEAYMNSVRDSKMTDMEEMTAVQLYADDTYGPMQLTTYLAAGEGDLYLLPKEEFVNYAANGYFIPLEEDPELIAILEDAEMDLTSGWRKEDESGETHLFGIPYQQLTRLNRYVYADDGFLCIFVNNGNTDNVLKFLRILSEDMLIADDAGAANESAAEGATDEAVPTENVLAATGSESAVTK